MAYTVGIVPLYECISRITVKNEVMLIDKKGKPEISLMKLLNKYDIAGKVVAK